MFSTEQEKNLRNIHIYEYADREKKGKAIKRECVEKVKRGKESFDIVEKEFTVPSPYQLAENVFEQILASGFSKVERVSPSDANCIIRVYQKLHYKYSFNIILNMYGADCFTKYGQDWITNTSRGDTFVLNYSKCLVHQWFYGDALTFDTEFVDIYVKVS